MTRRDFVKRAGLWVPAAGLLMRQPAQAAVTYFGFTTPSADSVRFITGKTAYVNTYSSFLTCPGTGKQSVKSLDAYVVNNGDPANIRLALYTPDGTFVCQGASQVSVTAVAYDWAWFGHTTFVDAAGGPISDPQIDGGSDYLIAVSADGPIISYRISSCASGGMMKDLDSTPGFPSPLGTGYTAMECDQYMLRCGVEPAGAGVARRRVVISQ
jgi:hypothetical protein